MISAYLVDRVNIIKWNGFDTLNRPIATTTVAVRGYVEWKTNLVRDIRGEEVVSQTKVISPLKVYLHMKRTDKALGRALRHEDRLSIDGRERSILSIHEPKAFGHPHYEVYLA